MENVVNALTCYVAIGIFIAIEYPMHVYFVDRKVYEDIPRIRQVLVGTVFLTLLWPLIFLGYDRPLVFPAPGQKKPRRSGRGTDPGCPRPSQGAVPPRTQQEG